ncbi:MAG: response regulator [Flavobacteriales bacterium]|nr:response regulator [Flavobacteriales bacterium]
MDQTPSPTTPVGPRKTRARVLIVEDEALVRRDLQRSLEELGYEVEGFTDRGEEAVNMAWELRPDIVLMDIMLKGDLSGIDAAKEIRQTTGVPVIFLTAYSEDSTLNRAKVAEPFGYLVKPFNVHALHSLIEMAVYKGGREAEIVREKAELVRAMAPGEKNDYLYVKNRDRATRLAISDIHHVEAMKDYAAFHVRDKRYVVHGSMQSFEELLPARDFMRVHRSYIVRLDKIQSIENGHITVEHGRAPIPIGQTYLRKLLDRIDPV